MPAAFQCLGERVASWKRSRNKTYEGETPWSLQFPQQTPCWREEKYEPSCFAKSNLVASNPFRNVCYSRSTVTRIPLISAFPLMSGNWGLQKGSLSDSCRQVIDPGLMLLCDIWSTSLHIEFLRFLPLFIFFSFTESPFFCFYFKQFLLLVT